jgi:cystathionine beta-synthase
MNDTPSRHARPYESILDTVGWTPLVRLNRVTEGIRTPVYGKAEFMNPGGSVKDRIGPAIIGAAERAGELRPGGTIVEGTSGNTGVALALAAATKGYRCIFTIPDKMSQEKVRLLKAFGAEVIVTPTAVPPDHPDDYVMTAKRIARETPNAILANQFYNQANPEAHYATTGPEIWYQTDGRVTHLVASAGTGGTISGTGRYLKEQNEAVKVVAGDPDGSSLAEYWRSGQAVRGYPYKVEGIGNEKIPETLWFDVIDRYESISDRDAFHMARRLTREEGLFVGGSAGLIVHLALQVAREVDDPDALVVAILCDTGERYLSKVFNDEWLQENRLIEPERLTADTLLHHKDPDTPDLVVVRTDQSVREALELITGHDVSQLPVLDEGRNVGSVTEETLMARVIEDPAILDTPVADLMGDPFPDVDGASALDDVARLLTRQTSAVVVRRDGALTGIITRYDMVRQLTG